MSTFIYTKPVPIRNVPSGTITIVNGTTKLFPGLNALQLRYRFIISNRDAAKTIEVTDSSGRVLLPIYPQQTIAFQSSDDLNVQNNSGADVSYNVLEEFFDVDQRGHVGGTRTDNRTSGERSGVIAGGPGGGTLPGVPLK